MKNKNLFGIAVLLLIAVSAKAQKEQQATIRFSLDNASLSNVEKIYIQSTQANGNGLSHYDSIAVDKKEFTYRTSFTEPKFVIVGIIPKPGSVLPKLKKFNWVLIDTSAIDVRVSLDSLVISGSIGQKINNIVELKLNRIADSIKLLKNQLKTSNDSVVKKELQAKLQGEGLQWPYVLKQLFLQYKTTNVATKLLAQLFDWNKDTNPATTKDLYDLLPEKQKSYPSIEAIHKLILVSLATSTGQEMPDFVLPDTRDVPHSLSSVKGKVILVDFWASWCVPCREAIPEIRKLYAKYHKDGFQIVSVSIDLKNMKTNWLNAIKTDSLTWLNLTDNVLMSEEKSGIHTALAEKLGIKSIPASFLLDSNYKIIGKDLQGDALTRKLNDLFSTQ